MLMVVYLPSGSCGHGHAAPLPLLLSSEVAASALVGAVRVGLRLYDACAAGPGVAQ